MVIHGSERMYVEDKSVNNHPKQTVNHHGLDKGPAPTQLSFLVAWRTGDSQEWWQKEILREVDVLPYKRHAGSDWTPRKSITQIPRDTTCPKWLRL